jgi:class 3 adenylate cyclase
MNPFDSITAPQKADLLICFCDIENFTAISRAKPDPLELFQILSGMAKEMSDAVRPSSGRIVKFIGDSALVAFPASAADEGVRLLLGMKARMERFLARSGFKARVLFQVHLGEAAVGPFGESGSLDVMGDAVNHAARLGRGEGRGRFLISPEAFRKLEPETRKSFHKFTPPVYYVAENAES